MDFRYILFSIYVNGCKKAHKMNINFGMVLFRSCLFCFHYIASCSHHIDCSSLCLFQGTSTKYSPQRVGLQHQMHDEDVIQIIKKWLEHKLIIWQQYCPFFSAIFHCTNLSGTPIPSPSSVCCLQYVFNTRPRIFTCGMGGLIPVFIACSSVFITRPV